MGLPGKQMNGSVANGSVVVSLEDPTTYPTPGRLGAGRQVVDIVKSAIPYLGFLMIYGINPTAHILPRFEDMDKIHLYNITDMEISVIGCQPHRWVSSHHSVALDPLSAVPYLMHYVLPVLYPVFLYVTGRPELISRFYWLLGCTMWASMIFWYNFPTAPPWVYDNLAMWQRMGTTKPPLDLMHREGCAFSRLDKASGLPFFFNMFSGNPVPFASFPSGHVAWPMCIYAVAAPGGNYFLLYVAWVAWATLYSCHHYLSDAVAAFLIVLAVNRLINYLRTHRSRLPTCSTPTAFCPNTMRDCDPPSWRDLPKAICPITIS